MLLAFLEMFKFEKLGKTVFQMNDLNIETFNINFFYHPAVTVACLPYSQKKNQTNLWAVLGTVMRNRELSSTRGD